MVQEAGRLRPSDREKFTNPAAARRAADGGHDTLRRFASCIVSGAATDRERKALAAFLRVSPENPAASTRAAKIVRENCIYGTGADVALLGFQPSLLRGAIFRQLYLDLSSQAPVRVTRYDIAGAWSPEAKGNFAATRRIGDCIVAANQDAAAAFVRAKVASVQQDAALREVMGRMSGCIPEGLTLQMSRVVLDGVLAEALYRASTGSSADTSVGQARVVR